MLERMPAEIQMGDNLENELAYVNHRSAAKCRGEVLINMAISVALGRAMDLAVVQAKGIVGLQISQVDVVVEEKLRVLHG